MLNDEEIIVHREYHLDSYDHQEEDYDDYDDDYEYHGGDEILSSPNYNNDDQNWVTTTTNTAITTNGWPDYIGDYDSGWGDEGK